VVENMPGAGGIKAANYLQGIAVADGTAFATFNNSIPFYQAIGLPGVTYKAESFSYIGSLTQTPSVSAVWHGTGVKTVDDARRIEVIMGATGAAGTKVGYAALLNNTLGTRFKIVAGYDGSNSVMLAIERGEVEGDASNPYSSWKTNRPDWIKDRKIIPIVQIGLKKDPDLPDVPLLADLAQTDEQRQMFAVVAATVAIQQPFAGPPGIPDERLTMLRRAFDRMAKDPAFRAEVDKARLDLDPLPGEEVARIVRLVVETPPSIIQKVQAAMSVKDAARAPGSGGGTRGDGE
jgi:tripartite-type tricarboxylate transporter receptor subunit TctC